MKRKRKLVESIQCVSLLISKYNFEQKINDIKEFKVNILVMEDDRKEKLNELKYRVFK